MLKLMIQKTKFHNLFKENIRSFYTNEINFFKTNERCSSKAGICKDEKKQKKENPCKPMEVTALDAAQACEGVVCTREKKEEKKPPPKSDTKKGEKATSGKEVHEKKDEKKDKKEEESKCKKEKEILMKEDICTDPVVLTNYDDCRVVIIGAGIAGLTAAKYLEENLITNYVVLEALKRPGGRIESKWLNNTVVELGSPCPKPSGDPNPIIQGAICKGFIEPPFTYTSIFESSDGHRISTTVSLYACELFKKIYCESLNFESDALDFVNFRIEQELKNFPDHIRSDAARIMYGLLAMQYKRDGKDIQRFINQDKGVVGLQIPGGKRKILLGYFGTIQPMLDVIPAHKLHFNSPVQNIRWGAVVCKDTPRAIVTCVDGSVYPADYVIITVSLGVLKANSESLFCPSLPAEKMEAIRNIGYRHVNSIYLHFAEPLWSWSTEEINIKFTEKNNQCLEGWTKGIVCIKQLPGCDDVLCATITGENAFITEKLSDNAIAEGIINVIRHELKIVCIPSVLKMIRSKWSSNIYFLGAYSYLPRGTCFDTQQKLSSPLPGCNAPVSPILFFAGEATSPKLNATVQGARISGIREASRIQRIIVTNKECVATPQQKVAASA